MKKLLTILLLLFSATTFAQSIGQDGSGHTFIFLGSFTTAGRPTAATANKGTIIFNSDSAGHGFDALQVSDGATWTSANSVANGGTGSQTLQQVFTTQLNNAILTFQDTISGRPIIFTDTVVHSNVFRPSVANGQDLGTAAFPYLTAHVDNITPFSLLQLGSTTGNPIKLNPAGVTAFQALSGGQIKWDGGIGNAFPGNNVTDSVVTFNNGFLRTLPIASIGGTTTLARQRIITGTSATGTSGNILVTFNFSSTVSAFAFTMPASPTDQQVVSFEGGGTLTTGTEITTLTLILNSGQNNFIQTTPLATFNVGEHAVFRWDAVESNWFRDN